MSKKTSLGSFALVLIVGLTVVFSLLSLVASLVMIKTPDCWSGALCLVGFLGLLWLIFDSLEVKSRSKGGFFSHNEVWFLMVLSLFANWIFLRWIPGLGYDGRYAPWDPKTALASMSAGKVCVTHVLRNQYWCNYEVLLSSLAVIFKGGIETAQMVNVLCRVAAIWPVFRLAECVGGRRIARFTGMTLAFMPSLVMYTGVLTSENLSACGMVYAAYFFLQALTAGAADRRRFLSLSVFAGVSLGVSYLFKTVTIVFVLAAIYLLVVFVARDKSRAFVMRLLLIAGILLSVYRVTQTMGQRLLADIVTQPALCTAASDSSVVLYELVLGLNVTRDGQYEHRLCQLFLSLPPEQRGVYVREMVARDWPRYPKLMVRKFLNIHGSPNYWHGMVAYFAETFRDGKNVMRMPTFLRDMADYGCLTFKILFLLGTMGLALSLRRSQKFLAPGVFSALIVVGFAMIEQLIEGHGRYKMAVYPFYFLILPYVCGTFAWGRQLVKRFGQRARDVK